MGINRLWGVVLLAGAGAPFAVIAGAHQLAPRWFEAEVGGAPVSVWVLDAAMLAVIVISAAFRGGLASDAETPADGDPR